MTRPLLIGISARIHHPKGPVPGWGPVYNKTLHYFEQSVAHWVTTKDVICVMVPAIDSGSMVQRSELSLSAYADRLDGLVLQGGADIAPESYGETPRNPAWSGDHIRDRYEIDLFNAFVEAGKPVIGICRGCQLINVAFGGTLYQDLPTETGSQEVHANDALYDRVLHDIDVIDGSGLQRLYPKEPRLEVNSLHHQAVKSLGRDIVVEATSSKGGIVEAIRWHGPSYVFGMQWHPEFLAETTVSERQVDNSPILHEFLAEARKVRAAQCR